MREIKHLNFNWEYSPNFKDEYLSKEYDKSDFVKVNIPHSNTELPYNNFSEKDYQFESCYKKTINIPTSAKGKKIFLHFAGVMAYAKIYINNTFVMEHKGGYTPFKADLTTHVLFGEENVITVYVDSNERKEIPPFGFVIDYLTYGGIYREVKLEYLNPIYIENCFVKTKNVLSINKELELDIYLDNFTNKSNNITIIASIFENEKEIKKITKNFDISNELNQKIQIKDTIDNVTLWEPSNPALYTAKLSLVIDSKVIDEKAYRFGFREAKFKSDGFYLNGKKLKLRGLNRHQSFPYVGYAMPKSAQYKDAEILKEELCVNIVRLSHYPQSDHFLDRCDELGLLVFDEIPGWQHIGEEGEWWDIVKQHTTEMIRKDWNRPSIIIWGTRINESDDCDKLYEKTNMLAKELDDTRQTGGVRCIGGSNLIEDVYTYNDFIYSGKKPVLNKRKKIAKAKVPYLITEFNGHIFPTKKFDNVQRRISHALRHLEVLNAMYKDDEIAGAIGWCMFDYNTHKDFGSGDKICYHGVMDMFRIEKYAAAVYKSQQNETPVLEVAQSMENGDMDSSTRGDVYIFTNCDYVKLYINNKYINTFKKRDDLFPYIPNAPVLIDDFLGELLAENEIFNKRDSKSIKRVLLKADKVGENLPLLDKLALGYLFLKYKLTIKDGRDLYAKYFGGWGSSSTTYKFEGYKNDECVISKISSQVFKPSLSVEVDSNTLIEDISYDVTRVIVRIVDEHGEDLIYGSNPITITTNDKLQVIGPNMLSLIGGSIGFWVKTTGKSGDGIITITSSRFDDITKKIKIEIIK